MLKPIRIGSRQFRPGLIPSLATLAFVALTVSLGNWQTRRAEETLALERRIDEAGHGAVLTVSSASSDPDTYDRHRVSARGGFVANTTIFIDNQVLNSVAGYRVLTPLKIEGGDAHVLVDRGWIAAGDRGQLPQIQTPEGEQTIEGIAIVPGRRVFELAPETGKGPLRQHLAIAQEAGRLGVRLLPFVITQTNNAQEGLSRTLPHAESRVDMHRGYALQWYSLAALAAILYVFLNLKQIDTRHAGK